MENGIAKAADFRSAAFEQAFEPEERVVLPESGLPVVLRRPRLIFFTLTKHAYPADVAQKMADSGRGEPACSPDGAVLPTGDHRSPLQPEEIRAYADWLTEVLGAVFVKPRLALAPGPDEIHPNWLRPGDVQFIFQWITGGIVAPASPGETFRPADAGSVAGGRDVSLPAERDSARSDRRVEN